MYTVVAVSNGMRPLKLRSDKIPRFLTASGRQLTRVVLYDGCKKAAVVSDADFPLLMDLRALATSSNVGLCAGSSSQHCFISVKMVGGTPCESCCGSGGR